MRLADAGGENETNVAVDEFFIVGKRLEDGIGGDVGRKLGGQLKTLEKGEDGGGGGGGETSFFLGEPGGSEDAEADGFAVEQVTVTGGVFDAVADGVTEIEKGAETEGFVFVLADDAGFDGDVGADDVGESFAIRALEGGEFLKKGGVADDGVFDDFGEAFVKGAFGQGVEGVGIGENGEWLMKAGRDFCR